jgi:hypothetical protein
MITVAAAFNFYIPSTRINKWFCDGFCSPNCMRTPLVERIGLHESVQLLLLLLLLLLVLLSAVFVYRVSDRRRGLGGFLPSTRKCRVSGWIRAF